MQEGCMYPCFFIGNFTLGADRPDPKPLSQQEIDAFAPDPHARTNAINFLLAAVWRDFITACLY